VPSPDNVSGHDPAGGLADAAIDAAIHASFAAGVSGPLSVLEVELPASWDTGRLSRALFALRLQVVSSERRNARERAFYRLRVVEFDGAPIPESKRLKLIPALLSLLDGALAKRTA